MDGRLPGEVALVEWHGLTVRLQGPVFLKYRNEVSDF